MSDSSKNYLSYGLWLVIIITIILLILSLIPESFTDKYNLRTIDILSDIRKGTDDSTIFLIDLPEPPQIDTCKTGLTCFDDFSPKRDGLNNFYKALSLKNSIKRPVRIAFFGDSFIEGDIFCGDFREKLQEKFGGNGVGMLPLASKVSSFRQTIIHKYSNWKSFSVLDKPLSTELGISGNVFVPGSNSWVNYQCSKRKNNLDSCQRVSIFYTLKSGSASVSCKINKYEPFTYELVISDKIERLDIDSKIGEVNLSFSNNNQLYIYGVSLEDNSGIIVDNYSVRGTSGSTLRVIPTDKLIQFNNHMHYDLVIMEYGLNVMTAKRTDYKFFKDEMVKTVKHMQEGFPDASFLLIGISDRSMKKDGGYQSMPSIPGMIAAQKGACAETGIVFWNLFEAMGGNNSMYEFANSIPPKANKDYTHLTFRGGEFLGNVLFETIVYEKERYDEKKAYFDKLNKIQK